MTKRETIYAWIYGVPFALSVLSGLLTGFSGTHTPPIPFIIEVLFIPIGLVLLLVDAIFKRPLTFKVVRTHLVGLALNLFIVAIIIAIYFNRKMI